MSLRLGTLKREIETAKTMGTILHLSVKLCFLFVLLKESGSWAHFQTETYLREKNTSKVNFS
jgi:hypothetical protein